MSGPGGYGLKFPRAPKGFWINLNSTAPCAPVFAERKGRLSGHLHHLSTTHAGAAADAAAKPETRPGLERLLHYDIDQFVSWLNMTPKPEVIKPLPKGGGGTPLDSGECSTNDMNDGQYWFKTVLNG